MLQFLLVKPEIEIYITKDDSCGESGETGWLEATAELSCVEVEAAAA